MPLPTCVALVGLVILAAGASVFLVNWLGLSLGAATLVALGLAFLVKARRWL